MSGSKWCYCDFKGTMKSIMIISVFILIFPTTASSTPGDWFKLNIKRNSANEWQQWKDFQGKPIYINHDTKQVQRENPEKFNPEKGKPVTNFPYPKNIEEKIAIFNAQLDKSTSETFYVCVERNNILNDSYKAFMGKGAEKNLKTQLKMRFKDETNVQVGESFSKEWLLLLSKEISDPKNKYFKYAHGDNYESEMDPNFTDLNYFQFIGRVVGVAVYHQIPVNIYFVKPYYKIMLSRPIELADVQSADQGYYNSLMDADIETLKESITSTKNLENMTKDALINEIIREKYQTSVEKQMSAFLKGFNDLIPLHLLRIFTADELKEVIGGVQVIDVDDWKFHTANYNNDYCSKQVSQWFWNIMRGFSNEQRRRVLHFVVGSSTVPANGFLGLDPKFEIQIVCRNNDLIPTAGVCFNKITLSNYESEESLKGLLQKAIEADQPYQLM